MVVDVLLDAMTVSNNAVSRMSSHVPYHESQACATQAQANATPNQFTSHSSVGSVFLHPQCCHRNATPHSRTRHKNTQAWPPATSPRPCSLKQMPPKPRHQITSARSTSCARLPLASFRPPPAFGHCHAGTAAETLEVPPLCPSPRNHSCRSKRRVLLAVD